MVFCGKPSKGCHSCRTRKILCDQGRPGCSQCLQGGWECPGYRDTLSLMFRDESERVIRKATTGSLSKRSPQTSKRSRAAPSRARPSRGRVVKDKGVEEKGKGKGKVQPRNSPKDEDSEGDSSSFALTSTTPTTTISTISTPETIFIEELVTRQPQSIQPSWQPTQNEAISWFLRHNAWPGALFMIDFNPDVLAQMNMSMSEKARMASIVSCATALLGRLRKSTELKEVARQEYGHALGLLTRALSNEEESRTNATLSAVLLMALFEVITSRSLDTMEKWTSHVYGASTLLELRGQHELQSPEGLKLFIQLRFQIIISCLQRGLHVPKSVLECNKIAMYLRPQVEAYCDRMTYISGRLANLRADIFGGILTDTEEILSRACAMEAELIAWLAMAPPEFPYTVIEHPPSTYWTESSGVRPPLYNDVYHLYHDLWVCHTWNQYRFTRIIICEITLSCLRRLLSSSHVSAPSEIQRQINLLRKTTRELALDICASAPYHFGADSVTGEESRRIPDSQIYVGGMLLLLPLSIAATTENREHSLRKWIGNCLSILGHGMGIDQAFAILEKLDTEAGWFEDLEDTDDGVVLLGTNRAKDNQILLGTWSSMINASVSNSYDDFDGGGSWNMNFPAAGWE
ncbi:hypothetical protein BJX68DRAFT_226138 [Aspergillus pseudodeflectus]|uniref:Zn(2)-C6 fungal-type domain-containing protein n=1 Tax=Aspergillus pseudodeflectus TaxID=176178 RepID=A0ABR4L4Q3_9EURO